MARQKNVSVYISYLLRHDPADAGLTMDSYGWVAVEELIEGVRRKGHSMDRSLLEELVARDSKGRYRFSQDGTRIKACQGHSLDFVEPELELLEPPEYLYHGTTQEALEKILSSGGISKMGRHAVHMQAAPDKAWQSAKRWRKTPVVLKIAALAMHRAGYRFGKTENDVWCTEAVPAEYLAEQMQKEQ